MKKLPKDVRVEVYDAIVEYGLSGTTSAALKPVAEALFTAFRARLEADMAKYESKILKLKESGRKGGLAKSSKCCQMLANAKGGLANATIDNDIVNDKETISNDIAKKRTVDAVVRYGQRIAMTEEAHRKLVVEYGEDFVSAQIAIADDWLLSKGRTQKDYAAFMRNWLRRADATDRLSSSRKGNGSELPQRKESEAFRAFFDTYPENRRKQRAECWQVWQSANLDEKPNLAANFAELVNVGIAYSSLNLLSMVAKPDEATQIRFNEAMRDKRNYYNEQIRALRDTATSETIQSVEHQIELIREERNKQYPYL